MNGEDTLADGSDDMGGESSVRDGEDTVEPGVGQAGPDPEGPDPEGLDAGQGGDDEVEAAGPGLDGDGPGDVTLVDGDGPGEANGGGPGSTGPTLVDVYEDEVVRLTAERDEYLDALRHLQADFENFRKRTVRQQAEVHERASEAVIQRLLPALDALDLALAHVGDRSERAAESELESAFVQIGSLLRDVLAKEGLERIDSTGVAFDPTVHDAVAHVPFDEDDSGSPGGEGLDGTPGPAVVEMLRAGYRLKGRVLRPAMVKVRA